MKRMISQSLITWVKSLFHRIAPGKGEGDIEIGGNLEVDGNITANGGINTDDTLHFLHGGEPIGNVSTGGLMFTIYEENPSNNYHYGIGVLYTLGTSIGILPKSGVQPRSGFFIQASSIDIYFNGSRTGKITSSGITIGSTSLTEDQLKKLLALIPE